MVTTSKPSGGKITGEVRPLLVPGEPAVFALLTINAAQHDGALMGLWFQAGD